MGYLHNGLGGREFLTPDQAAKKAAEQEKLEKEWAARDAAHEEWKKALKAKGLLTHSELGELIKSDPEKALTYLRGIAKKGKIQSSPDPYEIAHSWRPLPRTAMELYNLKIKGWSFLAFYDED